MEKVVRKLAKQLNVYDEASLMALWGQLSRRVASFEPTKEWEEDVLMLSMVQAVRWKNQLFNFNWAESLRVNSRMYKDESRQENIWPEFNIESNNKASAASDDSANPRTQTRDKQCKVLSFQSSKND